MSLLWFRQINTTQRNKIWRKEIGDVENKVPDSSGLATNAALNIKISAVENKISDISKLIKKADGGAKIKYIDGKYFTTVDYNKFASHTLNSKIKQKNLSMNLIFLIS